MVLSLKQLLFSRIQDRLTNRKSKFDKFKMSSDSMILEASQLAAVASPSLVANDTAVATSSTTVIDIPETPDPTINRFNPENVFDRYFNELPPELRTMVWKWVAFRPRIVHIRMVRDEGGDLKFISNNSVPAVLHANCESRVEALKWYKKDLAGFWTLAIIYFNHAVDTMYFTYNVWVAEEPGAMTCLYREGDKDGDAARDSDTSSGSFIQPGPAADGNRNAQIERLAINLRIAHMEDSIFEGVQRSNDLKILHQFENLQQLILFNESDKSVRDERGDIVSCELNEELEICVQGTRRTNAELQTMLERLVREKYMPGLDEAYEDLE